MSFTTAQEVLSAVRADAEIYIFSISFIFIGAVFLLLYLLVRQQLQQFLSFSIFSVSTGISLIRLASSYSVIIGSGVLFGVDIGALAYYLMPVGIIAFLESVLEYEPRRKKLINFTWKIFVIHAAVMTLLNILGVAKLTATNEVFTAAFILAIFPMFKTKRPENGRTALETRFIMIGAMVSGLTGIFDMVKSMIMPDRNVKLLYHWGMLILILCFMLSLLQRFKTTHLLLKERSQELEANNLSLQKAWKDLDELNKSLESRVEERTEQLKNANEELVAINDNLTETMLRLTETQAQLVQSEKISALGTLVAGVTHEINTPIATIKSNIQLEEMLYTQVDQTSMSSMTDYLEKVPMLRENNIAASDRISAIVHDLKNFARLDEAEFKEANLNDGVESTLALMNYKLSEKNIKVLKDLAPIPEVFCVPKQINQLVLILLENAIEAIHDTGEIRIATHSEKDRIILTISDSGCGIPAENLNKIFNPGFTTKGVGVGTGLGLAIAYKIVEQHKGRINVQSVLGKGTEFIVEIPVK
ncbi:MAG: ATP-binding protein [Clostridia bacterium]|nr:ATP-binding protein [Clostridia bacterium]